VLVVQAADENPLEEAPEEAAPISETFLMISWLLQAGHSTRSMAALLKTSSSKGCPQSRQSNS
jgi:hypothetical protein